MSILMVEECHAHVESALAYHYMLLVRSGQQQEAGLGLAPGVQPKPPSKLRHATTYSTAFATSMASSLPRMEQQSRAQYENL